ncbi:TPA: hypothetical protein ACJ5QD_002809 [Pseudomonas aeruginosa]
MIEENHQAPEQDLAGAIRDLLAHLRGPKVAPEDELWTTKEIGEYLKLSPATIEGRVVTSLTRYSRAGRSRRPKGGLR